MLQEQVAQDGEALPSKDPALFVAEMLRRSIDNHAASVGHPGPVFFDRGVPDLVAYAQRFDVDPAPCRQAADAYRYNTICFLLSPWRAIYTKDQWRGGEFEFYEAFHQTLMQAYLAHGYRFVEVPQVSVAQRADFVVAQAVRARPPIRLL